MNEMDTRFANQFNIQWFPGHMTKTLRMMEQEIQHVDASLVLLDARIPLSSLNPEIERITARKPKLYALNKADLADPAVTEEWIRYFRAADAGCVAISAKQKGGAKAVQTAIEKELSGLLARRLLISLAEHFIGNRSQRLSGLLDHIVIVSGQGFFQILHLFAAVFPPSAAGRCNSGLACCRSSVI